MTSYSEHAMVEQAITDFFGKSLHVILESRCLPVSSRNYSGEQLLSSPSPPSSASSSPSFRKRDNCSTGLENVEFWRQNNCGSITVDIVLMQRQSGRDADGFGIEVKNEKIIERWVLEFESRTSRRDGRSCSSPQALQESTLLLRSLHATVRLLPAYKLFSNLISSPQIRLYNLGHRVSSFVEPFTSREEADMQDFTFTPLDTSCGRISVSVKYCQSLLDVSSDEPSTPMSPQLIPEYVGSPLAEKLKRLPSSTPFGRRHSWSYDLYRASSPAPSPTFSDSDALLSKQRCAYLPPTGLPRPLHDGMLSAHKKNQSYDDYWPSPMVSPSPSPPTRVSGSRACKVLLRCESDPFGVPASRLSCTPLLPKTQVGPPSPKTTQPTVYKQATRLELNRTSSTPSNQFSFNKDKTGKTLDAKPLPNTSQSTSFSRYASRLKFRDDYDDLDFSGPFVIDDDDIVDLESSYRPGSSDGILSAKKMQNSRVGELVCMLQKAPALASDTNLGEPGGTAPLSMSASRTATDALEELRLYKEIRDEIVKKR